MGTRGLYGDLSGFLNRPTSLIEPLAAARALDN
jgi:hypothetical protein